MRTLHVTIPFVLTCALAAQQPFAWRPIAMLTGSVGSAMVYDSHRERTVLVVAVDGSPSTATFEYDGTRWQPRVTAHQPPARSRHQVCFDTQRGRVVLFGGIANNRRLDDTWEYDGVDWLQRRTVVAPSPRVGHTMAYDTAHQRSLLYGGEGVSDMMWQWDGATWQQLPAPPGIYFHENAVAAYDSARRRCVVHGGWVTRLGAPWQPTNETWEWDGRTWFPMRPAAAPTYPSSPTAMVYDSGRQRTVLPFQGPGGWYQGAGTWEWDGTNWSRTPNATFPITPFNTTCVMAYDSARARVVHFEGETTVTREYDGATWVHATTASVIPPYDSYRVSDPARRRLSWLNGWGARHWNGARWAEEPHGLSPLTYLLMPGLVRDEARNEVLCYGGATLGYQPSNQTFVFDGTTWQLRQPAQSPPPGGRQLFYDPLRQRAVLLDDLTAPWEWDGVTWQRAFPTITPPWRAAFGVTADLVQGGLLLHGGSNQFLNDQGDSWLWDGVAWRQLASNGPTFRRQPQIATDPVRQRILMLGELRRHVGAFEWNGQGWRPLPDSGLPEHTEQDDLAWDPGQQRIVLLRSGGSVWSYGVHTPSGVRSFGRGCGGAGGTPLLVANQPQLGNDGFGFDVLHAAPATPCAVCLSLNAQQQPIGAGCTLRLLQPFVPFVTTSNGHGFATVKLPLPVDPMLRGQTFVAQAIALDATAPLGVTLTAALRLALGD